MTGPDRDSADDVLFVGDVHLGRRPVGLDQVLRGYGLTPQELSPAAALTNLVEHALAHPPRAVVFAGDLVDQEEDRFEACSILEREVARLRDADIPVLAVAGNHDGLVLPRLIERVAGVKLLGAGGVWERHELLGAGPPIDLLGWSFPSRHVTTCPLDHASFAAAHASLRPGALSLGVVHGDLGVTSSNYAPIPRARLDETALAAWFLGHVHKPGDLSGGRPIGYLGSLVGLHSNEPGPHGPWRVRAADAGVQAEQVLLAPVRWETLTVELTDDDVRDGEELYARIEASLRGQLSADATLHQDALRLVVVEAQLTGRLADRSVVSERAENHEAHEQVFQLDGLPVIVRRLEDTTRTAVDLGALAGEPTAIGHVAGRLLELEAGRADEALKHARETIQTVACGQWGVADDDHPLPPAQELLERATWSVLDVLLAQREEAARA
jgi:DNA repair exonuclease SbcCD nuclease subunit